jgi:deoxyadenosine/deoxycytidine kinase
MVKRVIVEGLIGAGKSTVIDAVTYMFESNKVKVFPELVDTWTELPLFYDDPAAWCLPLNLRILLSQKVQYSESVECAGEHAIHVFERSPLSCRHVFCQSHFNEGVLSQKQWRLFKDFYELLKWEPGTNDLIVYIDTPVEVCHDRVKKRNREGETPIDLKYLHKLEFQYANNLLTYTECPVVKINGLQSEEAIAKELYGILKNL